MRHYFKAGLILCMALLLAVSAFGQSSDMKTIHIVTPEWEDQTNKDGTGLYFDIVRSVYEPVGIKMKYEIVPWKRAEKMISTNKADAMLSARKIKGRLTPEYPMFVEHTSVVFKKERIKEWKGIKTLNNSKVLWLRGYDFHLDENMKDITLNKFDEVDSFKQAWGMLAKNRTDFYIDVLVDIELYIRKHKVDMKPYQVETIWENNAYMSFSKTEKSKKLIEIYDKKIIELFKSGELEKLYKKWEIRFSLKAWSK